MSFSGGERTEWLKGVMKRSVEKFLRMVVGSTTLTVVMVSVFNHTSVFVKFSIFI